MNLNLLEIKKILTKRLMKIAKRKSRYLDIIYSNDNKWKAEKIIKFIKSLKIRIYANLINCIYGDERSSYDRFKIDGTLWLDSDSYQDIAFNYVRKSIQSKRDIEGISVENNNNIIVDYNYKLPSILQTIITILNYNKLLDNNYSKTIIYNDDENYVYMNKLALYFINNSNTFKCIHIKDINKNDFNSDKIVISLTSKKIENNNILIDINNNDINEISLIILLLRLYDHLTLYNWLKSYNNLPYKIDTYIEL